MRPHRKGSRAALSRVPLELFRLGCVLLRLDLAHSQDILRSSAKTTGTTETNFKIGDV